MAADAAAAGASAPTPVADAALVPLVRALQAFYRQHARDLPWRHTRDPYAIWLSEIMCQQTRVDTVVPRYRAFLRAYPTVQALAAATTHDVCGAWAGLGYYRRARHLHQAAQQVCREHGGQLPRTAAELRRIVGIGPYTAGAIASIAFGEAAPLVDGNVARLLSRIFCEPAPIDTTAGSKLFWGLAARLVAVAAASGSPGDFNQALMEMGATVCTPRRPRCDACPVRGTCLALAGDQVDQLPRQRGKQVVQPMQISFVYCPSEGGTLLQRRDLEGLWAGLWELPSAHGADGPEVLRARGYVVGRELAQLTHLLSHRRITATVFAASRAAPAAAAEATQGRELRAFLRPLEAPLSTLARRAIVAAESSMIEATP